MARLSAAYHGYDHQDLVAAYALASLLLPRADVRLVSAERKAVDDDRFDDLELGGRFRRRAQIKSHTAQGRCLQLADLTTDSIDFRIDRAVRSVSNDSAPADRYVLFATYSPCGDLLPFLQACPSVLPFLPGINTSRFSLRVDHIWPEGGRPRWRALGDVDRAAFLEFSRRFVIDVGCPSSSADLRAPGELEKALLALLRDGIGVGLFPNDSRDVADAAAHLVYAARALRTSNGTWREDEVIRALALRIDYGRVEEVFPVDDDRLVPRSDVLDEIVAMLDHSPRVAVTGPPGIGKSWLVRQLWSYLRDKGWIAVAHYCFVDLFDNARYRRASVSVTFGSIIAELYETDRSLVPLGVPRFAAGPVELEKVIKEAVQTDPNRRIAIIVDGLDHVDRLPGRSSRETASEIVEELAMVSLPTGVAVVVVSQPGLHLDSFLSVGVEYSFSRWPDQQMRDLVARTNLERTLRATDLEGEVPQIIDTIVDRAAGNPLYATYLVRTARDVAGPQSAGPAVVDIPAHLATAPPFDRDLRAYYEWLVDGIDRDTGVVWIGEMLALLDFAITSEELKQIRPDFRGHVDRVLNRLAPVLAEDVVRGGLRIYHESFQRHMRARLDAGAQPDAAAMLAPVIAWLEARGFFSDERAFRSLFMLLKRAGRDAEIPTRITDDFLARSAAHAQAGDAVMANLASAAILAASRRDWSFMARLLELSRACDNLYRWRLAGEHDLAQEYGRTYAELFGAKSLSDRLLYDGRCTFLPRPGLLLCRLCDYEGVIPPWREYIAAQREQERTENTMYGDEADRAIAAARLTGHLRLVGREKAIADCRIWLSSSGRPPLPHFDVATELGRMYGSEATQDIVASLPASTARAWTRLALAEMADTPALAQAEAERAIEDGLPVGGWRTCLRLGAAPAVFPKPHEDLDSLTEAVLEKGVEFDPGRVTRWLTEIALSAAVGSDDALRRAERRILPDTWYHKWLLFCLTLGRTGNQTEALLTSLRSLSDNTEVFKGEPRACDLLQLHGEIRSSFGDLLSRLDQDQWLQAFEALANICRRTTTYLQGSRCGPLTLDALLDLCHSTADTPQKRAAATRFGASLLTAGECAAEFYDTHARDSLLLTRIHLASGEQTLAAGAWEDACRYLTGYGWRKDITVYEVLDSLPDLGQADPIRARRCIKAIQPVVEGVLVHTDGKETRHAIHKWLDIAAQIHPAGALAFLAHREVAKLPSIGYLDHAMPRALAALADQVDPLELAAGWLAVGAEARSEAVAAVAACEKAAKLGAPSGAALWNVVVASLDGDGVEAAVGLRQLAGESAVRLKRPEPEIDSKPPNTDDGPTYHSHALPGVLADELSPQKFSVPATPLQIPSMVRRWRDTAETQRADFDAVANAVGWRILELVEGGDEATAELVIRRLAHDVSPIGQDSLVATLAEGLKLRGHHRLAAFASALAYTSAYDGWLRFGGSKGIFLDALELDRDLTWSIFADELAGRVAVGGGTAVTTRLVQLLVAGGHIDQAFSSWEAACSVIASRLPRTGPADDIDASYDIAIDDPSAMLAAAIVARMNYLFIHEKRFAAAALALLARYSPQSFACGLDFAAGNGVPPWTLITLLHVLLEFEVEPYTASRATAPTLRSIAIGELVSARVLATALLERAGLPAPTAHPSGVALLSRVADHRADELAHLLGEERIERINRVWPDFGIHAIGQMDAVFRSEDMRRRMGRALDHFRLGRKGCRLARWFPIDEEAERVLQITGSAVRCALAQGGVLDASAETEVGMRLLGDTETMVRLVLSRTTRPTYAERLRSKGVGLHVADLTVDDCGEFADWVVVGFREMESKISGHDSIDARVTAYAGVVFTREWEGCRALPFGRGDSRVWSAGSYREVPEDPLRGPLAALQDVIDPFGGVKLFVPHPLILVAGRLDSAPFDSGLTLIDQDDQPAVVCRIWRRRLIGTEYFDDREHRIDGLELLVRPDVFSAVSNFSSTPPRLVTLIVEHPEG